MTVTLLTTAETSPRRGKAVSSERFDCEAKGERSVVPDVQRMEKAHGEYNYGIALLRIFACFGVVSLHFGTNAGWAAPSVPLFMAVALYLSGGSIGNRLLPRLRRLYIPFVFWGVVCSALRMLYRRTFDPMAVVQQFLFGAPACPVLYFTVLLAVNTIFIAFLSRVASPKRLFACMGSGIILCFCLQYSGINIFLFGELPWAMRYTLGRFLELLPYSLVGYCACRFSRLAWPIGRTCLVSASLFACGVALKKMNLPCPGFMYSGLPLFFKSVGLFVGAVFVGKRLRLSGSVARIVSCLSGLTAGIYYVHLMVGTGLNLIIGDHRGFAEALLVFTLSGVLVFSLKRFSCLRAFVS